MKLSEKTRKGIGMGLVVIMVVLVLFWLFTYLIGAAGKVNLINDKKLLQQTFEYKDKYSKVMGELNQHLTVNNFENMDPKSRLGSQEKGLMLSEWLALYSYSQRTENHVPVDLTDPGSEMKKIEDMKKTLKNRLEKSLDQNVQEESYYNLTVSDISIESEKPEDLEAYSVSLLPVPSPGGKIFYAKYKRQGTTESIKLIEESEE